MAKLSASEQLDQAIQAVLAAPAAPRGRDGASRSFDPSLGSAIEVVGELRHFPRERFRDQLRKNLERRASMASSTQAALEPRASATPYLSLRNAAAAVEFYKNAFGAIETMRLMQPDGRLGHSEITIEGARIMLADEFPEYGFSSPQTLGGSPIHIHLEVPDVDAFARRAVDAGAVLVRPVEDQFYGARSGQLRDPFGYTWSVSTHKETLSTEEMQRRIDEVARKESASAAQQRRYIREGFRSITPYLIVPRAGQLIDFITKAFGAVERYRVGGTDQHQAAPR